MIWGEPTKQLGGITLWGDAWDLNGVYELIHHVASDTGLLEPKTGEFLLGLAYDLRKAKERQRYKRTATLWDDEKVIYGVDVVWVYLLLQVGILRAGAAFMTLKPRDQANLWALEAAVHEALKTGFGPELGDALFEQARGFRLGSWDPSLVKSNGRAAYFLHLDSKAKRKAALLPVMRTLDPMYEAMWKILGARAGAPDAIDPSSFTPYDRACDDILASAKL